MPELPEVELVARALHRHLASERVVSARLLRPGLLTNNTPRVFSRQLRMTSVESVRRRGKFLLFEFNRRLTLLAHLRMTGRFLITAANAPLPAHTHAVFNLSTDRRLLFVDQRHFGIMKLIPTVELPDTPEIAALAPEPFADDFTVSYLAGVLSQTKRNLKDVLLDQRKVTGLGNIYAAEAMFQAGIDPFVPADSLSLRRVVRLHEAILNVFREAIAHGSTLNVDPENIEGSYYGGGYAGRWSVYDREGEKCRGCSSVIRRVMKGGRSTYFCGRCQKR